MWLLFQWILLQTLIWVSAATDNGYSDLVSWDRDSLIIDGERVFIFAGEFHHQRLPVRELWRDVLEKFKANGMNTVSFYHFWSYHSAARGVYDFGSGSPANDLQYLFDLCKELGLYVISRPGPYCNAETNAGGLARWTSDGSGGKYRTSDPLYYGAWSEYFDAIVPIIAKNQITNGGPIILVQIENELQQTVYEANNTLVVYMEQLKTSARKNGIVVPITHNEKGMRAVSWSSDYKNAGGAVDIYALDSYPGGLSCTNTESGFNLVRTYYQWFQNYSYTQPSYLAEFEGGWFQPWGGAKYDDCEAEHSPEFADVYYKSVIAQRVTLLSLYMTFGGTNWGHLAAPMVYTSYDYSAPLRETREVQDKFKQIKLIGLFTRVSPDLLAAQIESKGAGNAVNNSAIWTWVLRNPETGAGFYLAENANSKSRAITPFTLQLKTSAGPIAVSTLALNGRQSRFVVTDYPLGADVSLLYSTAEILTYGLFDRSVVVFYLKEGQTGEFAFKDSDNNVTYQTWGASSAFTAQRTNGTSEPTRYSYVQARGTTVVQFSNGVLAYLLGIPAAYTFFAPSTASNPRISPSEQVFVLGPILVRSATFSGSEVLVVGNNTDETTIEIYPPSQDIETIVWNGNRLSTTKTEYGSLQAQLSSADKSTILPALTDWQKADSLPELDPAFDDSSWVLANKTTTSSPVKPLTLPVLFSSDYGFYTGIKLYRGRFDGLNVTGANITVQGGLASGWSAWLNGVWIGGHVGNATLGATNSVLSFSEAKLQARDNVLTVVTDYTGHDQTSTGPAGASNPRGILGASLLGGAFSSWRIQGNEGGHTETDPIRGPLNTGGLFGERMGWHLPFLATSSPTFSPGSPLTGLDAPGIAWYTTKFTLDLPSNYDVPLGIRFTSPAPTPALRVQLFVNGHNYGQYFPHIGPQDTFPVSPGILNARGTNKISLSLRVMERGGGRLEKVEVVRMGGVYESGFDFGGINGGRLGV